MKVFLLCLLAISARAATVTATLTYQFTTAVACSATVITNCMVNFQFGYLRPDGTFSAIGTIPLPATLSGTQTLPPAVFPFNGVYGVIQFAATVAYQDQGGKMMAVNPPFAPPTAAASVGPAQVSGLAVSVSN